MRNPSLDLLRGAAVLLVFCFHSEGALLVGRFGWTGVDLFFVLSGFLVSGLLFREYEATRQLQPGRFLLRRGLKIYPQFYFFIASLWIFAYTRGTTPHVGQLVAELLFVQNYAPGIWSHTWSLGVEEHFYLLLTFGMVMLARRGGENPFRSLPKWIAVSCVLILAMRTLHWYLNPQISDYRNVFPSHLRIDSLLMGVLVSYLHTFHHADVSLWMRRLGGWVPPVSIALLAPVTFLLREDPFMVTVGYSMVSWAFSLLLLSVLYPLKPSPAAGRLGRGMIQLGRHSYAFYLWHGPILFASESVKQYIEVPMFAMLVLTFGASLLAAIVTTRLIELPVLGWRDRMFPADVRSRQRDTSSITADVSAAVSIR